MMLLLRYWYIWWWRWIDILIIKVFSWCLCHFMVRTSSPHHSLYVLYDPIFNSIWRRLLLTVTTSWKAAKPTLSCRIILQTDSKRSCFRKIEPVFSRSRLLGAGQGRVLAEGRSWLFCFFWRPIPSKLGPGRPSAGGPSRIVVWIQLVWIQLDTPRLAPAALGSVEVSGNRGNDKTPWTF